MATAKPKKAALKLSEVVEQREVIEHGGETYRAYRLPSGRLRTCVIEASRHTRPAIFDGALHVLPIDSASSGYGFRLSYAAEVAGTLFVVDDRRGVLLAVSPTYELTPVFEAQGLQHVFDAGALVGVSVLGTVSLLDPTRGYAAVTSLSVPADSLRAGPGGQVFCAVSGGKARLRVFGVYGTEVKPLAEKPVTGYVYDDRGALFIHHFPKPAYSRIDGLDELYRAGSS